jgi:hypothetical protein
MKRDLKVKPPAGLDICTGHRVLLTPRRNSPVIHLDYLLESKRDLGFFSYAHEWFSDDNLILIKISQNW